MINDPIVAAVRRDRQAYAAKFKFNLQAIFTDLRSRHQIRVNPDPKPSLRRTTKKIAAK
jgi:hypothetical protein